MVKPYHGLDVCIMICGSLNKNVVIKTEISYKQLKDISPLDIAPPGQVPPPWTSPP